MPRDCLKPEEISRIRVMFNKGKGEVPSFYYFKNFAEFEEKCSDNPEIRGEIQYLPEHRAYVSKFDLEGAKAGDFYLHTAGQDDPYTYSTEVYVVENSRVQLMQVISPSLVIRRYLAKIILPAKQNDLMLITISTLDDEGKETYVIFSKFLPAVVLNNVLALLKRDCLYQYSTEDHLMSLAITLLIKGHVNYFAGFNDYDSILGYIEEGVNKKKPKDKEEEEPIKCHCEDCTHNDEDNN